MDHYKIKMADTINIRVDKTLREVLEDLRKSIALDFKNKYSLQTITISGTLASQVAAAKLSGKKNARFRIRKQGLNKGVLELI